MEGVRFPLGTTRGNLECFNELLQSRLTFGWPSLLSYSSSKISDIVSSCKSNSGFYEDFVRFDVRFDISVRHCVFDELELQSLRTSMCPLTTSFGTFDDESFAAIISNDRYVAELLSKIETDDKIDVISAILNKAQELLKTPGFFDFRYVRYDSSPLRATSVSNASNSFSNVSEYLASQIADVYLETYYVFPIERLYTGLFFDAMRTFTTSILCANKEKMNFHEDESLLYVLTALETLRRRPQKECLFLLQGDCENEVLDKLTKDLNALTVVKRNLLDCPERFLSERCKKQIRSVLNFRAISACLMSNEDSKIFGRSLGGYNLSLITNPFAVRYDDYAANEIDRSAVEGKLRIIERDCYEIDFSDLRIFVENHVFRLALLAWHIRNYEKTSSSSFSFDVEDPKKMELVFDAIDYLKDLNSFAKTSDFSKQIGTLTLGSKSFGNIKKFLGLSIRGKKALVVDISRSGFVSKCNKTTTDAK